MAKKKAGGKVSQGKRPAGKRLGVKAASGQRVTTGAILVRQRGTKILAGSGVNVARDHSLFALKKGVVNYKKSKGRTLAQVV